MEKIFLLKGLDCPHCSAGIEKDISNAAGVNSAAINLMRQTLVIDLDPAIEDTVTWLVTKTVHRYEPAVKVSEIRENSSKIYLLKGLDCPNCAASIERDVAQLEYVKSAAVDLINQTLSVEFSDISQYFLYEMICDIVNQYEPDVEVTERNSPIREESKPKGMDKDSKRMLARIIIGAVLYIASLIIPKALDLSASVSIILLVIPYIILGADIVWKAIKNIIRGRVFDENFLMMLSTVGAFVIGEYPEAVAVMLFYQVGEFFQSLAVRRSRRSISELMDIRPASASVIRNGEVTEVAPETISVGEMIVIKPGEKIPLDGVIIEGESSLDTKALTGESVPQTVRTGDEVISGCINQSGVLTVVVRKAYSESTVSKIIDLVENASSRKAPTENFITTFAKYYTPIVVILAAMLAVIPPLILGGGWSDWIHRGFVFLVISCPCALVISIPLTFFGGIGTASRHGVLVKGSNYLEALNNIDTVVFDKTGTLTKGIFEVTDIIPAEGFEADAVLEYAAKAEQFSNHPIAKSILYAYNTNLSQTTIENYRDITGHGISAIIDGEPVLAGNAKLMEENRITFDECSKNGTKVYVAVKKKYIGCIIISDEIKADSKEAIRQLKRAGVQRTVMLTGDNEQTAAAVANELAIDEYHAQLLPAEKVEILEQLDSKKRAGSKLAFVGDGINDAPVLARADIGIAMGGLGSDAAIEAADVVLMTDEPTKLIEAIDVARSTKRIVIQNIVFALGIKAVFLILGAFGIAGMWEAVFGDVGVALIAIINAMRILKK